MAPPSKSDPHSYEWTAQAVGEIISTSVEMITIQPYSINNPKTTNETGIRNPFRAAVHKELLCFFSPYYAAAFKGEFLEANATSLSFDLYSDRQSAIFISWLYTGHLDEDVGPTDLVDLYIFADRTNILAFRRDIMTQIVRDLQEFGVSSYESASSAFWSLPERSSLRCFLVDSYVRHWAPENDPWDREAFNSVSRDFCYEVMKGLASRKPLGHGETCPCCENPCDYHEHEDEREWRLTCMSYRYANQSPEGAFYTQSSNIKPRTIGK